MSWISTTAPESAKGTLKGVYERILNEGTRLSNVLKVHSLFPEAMLSNLELYEILMYGSDELSRADCESLAVVVSAANNCPYCVSHHGSALSCYESDNSVLKKLLADFEFLETTGRESEVLKYALKLTLAPNQITEQDIAILRESGFTDRGILEINLISAYFNMLNRITLGLGVESSADEPQPKSSKKPSLQPSSSTGES